MDDLYQYKLEHGEEEEEEAATSCNISNNEDSQNVEEILINAVETFPCLWKMGTNDYQSSVLKERAWLQIAEVTGHDVVFCQKKWKNIRDYFVKVMKTKPSGAGQNAVEYKFEKRLQFLKDIIKRKKISRIVSVRRLVDPSSLSSSSTSQTHTTGKRSSISNLSSNFPTFKSLDNFSDDNLHVEVFLPTDNPQNDQQHAGPSQQSARKRVRPLRHAQLQQFDKIERHIDTAIQNKADFLKAGESQYTTNELFAFSLGKEMDKLSDECSSFARAKMLTFVHNLLHKKRKLTVSELPQNVIDEYNDLE